MKYIEEDEENYEKVNKNFLGNNKKIIMFVQTVIETSILPQKKEE